jgi:transcription termination/antitermination protein NusG
VGWYAIFTMPRHEQSVASYLDFQRIAHFLPAYEKVSTWRNRQTMRVKLPLFPRYLFARIERRRSGLVLRAPGALQIVGTASGPTPVPDTQIEILRTSIAQNKAEPYPYFAIGRRVRIRTGSLAGVEGTLVRRENRHRFVLTLSLIQQSVSIDVEAANLEAIGSNFITCEQ